MRKQAYTTRTGKTQYKPVVSEAVYQRAEDDMDGFCLACGATRGGCEPDARKYPCESCGEAKVYGLPELLLMGLVVLTSSRRSLEN
jgi:hypothetical protein